MIESELFTAAEKQNFPKIGRKGWSFSPNPRGVNCGDGLGPGESWSLKTRQDQDEVLEPAPYVLSASEPTAAPTA